MNQVALGRDELMHSAHVYLRVLEKKEANTLLCRACMHTCWHAIEEVSKYVYVHVWYTLLKYGGAQTPLISKRSKPTRQPYSTWRLCTAGSNSDPLCVLYGVGEAVYGVRSCTSTTIRPSEFFWACGWEVHLVWIVTQTGILLEGLPISTCFVRVDQ